MASPTYRFGEFRLDPANRKLWRGDEELSLPPKPFNCLVHLVEHRERAVEHDELIHAVWGDACLSDRVLAQNIYDIRHALHDNGEEQEYIETLRGFGYRWAVPVEVVQPPVEEGVPAQSEITYAPTASTDGPMQTAAATSLAQTDAAPPNAAGYGTSDTRSRGQPIRFWMPLALVAFAALVAGLLYLRRGEEPSSSGDQPPARAAGEIALLLPVTVDADSEHAWVRLGLMDLIAQRLREAGQAMVPGDTVVALLRGRSSTSDPRELTRLAETTGAGLVLGAQARATGTRWTVSLHSLRGAEPPLTAVGEAHDVLAAARAAADQMALDLGLESAAEPSIEPDLQKLLQQIEAARLAQQMDVALARIEAADPALRRHPEVRFQEARIAFHSHDLDTAKAAFESLLEEQAADRDPVLRARVLNGMAGVYLLHADPGAAEPLLHEATRLLRDEDTPTFEYLRRVLSNLAIAADMREDFDAATTYHSQVRRILESSGNVTGLATLDGNVGTLEFRRERYAEAIRHFESAADRYAAIQDVGDELRARAGLIQGYLGLLDPQAAAAVEPRVNALLARTTNEQLAGYASISRAYLLQALGRRRAAAQLVSQLSSAEETGDIRDAYRLAALLLRAEQAMTDDAEFARARDLATEVVEGLADQPGGYEERARAWLIVVRSDLAHGRRAAAAEASDAMAAWARDRKARSPKIYAALADAELAAADGRDEAARAAFERAFSLADSGHVPLHLLHVARSYVPWLLTEGARRAEDTERALFITERLAGYADTHYGAALLQLHVYQSVGPPSAWRASLDRAASLAGERQIPPHLRVAPRSDQGGATRLPLAARL